MNHVNPDTVLREAKRLAQHLRTTNPDTAVSALLSAIPMVLVRHGDPRQAFFQSIHIAQLLYYQTHRMTDPDDPAVEAAIREVMLAAGKVDQVLLSIVYMRALARMIEIMPDPTEQRRVAWHTARDIVTMAVPVLGTTPDIARVQRVVDMAAEQANDHGDMLMLLSMALSYAAGLLPLAIGRRTALEIIHKLFDALEAVPAESRPTVEE